MPQRESLNEPNDILFSHHSLDKAWGETLAWNLRKRGYQVFFDDWVVVPGRPYGDAFAQRLERSRKAVLVVTPEAVESGWVRLEYEAMVARSRSDRDFSFVLLVFGDLPLPPFLETVHCVDFRDPAPDAYRRAFHRLLCGLEDQPPGVDEVRDGELKVPEPLHLAAEARPASSGQMSEATSETEEESREATGQAISELRRISGLTWEQLGRLFGVSRRRVHFWASGKPLNAANEARLLRVVDIVRKADRGNARTTRAALLETTDSATAFDLLASERFDEARALHRKRSGASGGSPRQAQRCCEGRTQAPSARGVGRRAARACSPRCGPRSGRANGEEPAAWT